MFPVDCLEHLRFFRRCHKAYEAIESGNCLDAITDMCGAICEHYSTSYPLYHVIYKSCANRSLIVCWRNSRSYRQGEFKSQRRMYTPSGGCSLDSQVRLQEAGMGGEGTGWEHDANRRAVAILFLILYPYSSLKPKI